MDSTDRPQSRAFEPRISVLVPTFGRPERIEALLAHLDCQTLDAAAFEVVVVDDGSPEPVVLDAAAHAFELVLLRQENAGPGAARNTGLESCRAPLTLILNDDAVPAPNLLETHLAIRAEDEVTDEVSVLGTFRFTQEAQRHPFVRLLTDTDLLFQEASLRPGELHDWQFFWTCNMSLPTHVLREVGGFDTERFHEALVEDVELGYRLEQRGHRVLYRPEAVCDHDHVFTSEAYFRRMHRLGVNLARMYTKHRDPAILWHMDSAFGDAFFERIQNQCEIYHDPERKLRQSLARLERGGAEAIEGVDLERPRKLVRELGMVPFYRGLLLELRGHDPGPVLDEGPPKGELTTVIVPSYDALETTRRCLDAIRRADDSTLR